MTVSGNMKEKSRSTGQAWESDLAYGWSTGGGGRGAGGGGRGARGRRAAGPGSTMSAESDIRFTRRKMSRPCRGCCAALAAFLVFLLLAALAVYLGHLYLFRDPLNKQTFRGAFLATAPPWPEGVDAGGGGGGGGGAERGDTAADDAYLRLERFYRATLSRLYRASELRGCFTAADILALDNVSGATRVHFEVAFDPIFTAVETAEVREVVARELGGDAEDGGGGAGGGGGEAALAPSLLANITIVPDSFELEESWAISAGAVRATPPPAAASPPPPPSPTAAPPVCGALTLPLCQHLPYNVTAFPNLAGHATRDQLLQDLVAFRELLDAECSRLAHDFVCQLLQPQCSGGRVVPPCRAYCHAFHAGCGERLPQRLRTHFDCSRFPDYHGAGSCRPQPECGRSLEARALSRRLCDGAADCADAADERGCSHCAAGALRCALHPRCIAPQLRCDGVRDCPDGSDEAACLWVSESLGEWRRQTAEATLGAVRARRGYAVWAERGRAGKLCAAPHQRDPRALRSVATSLCRTLTFREAGAVEVVEDTEQYAAGWLPQYVEVEEPTAAEISFLQSSCPERRVLHVTCQDLECGTASARGEARGGGASGLGRSARAGDWPWHAALLRAHVHACDATLLHAHWLLTTSSCFQGQAKAEWRARLGSVRVQSTTPWQQERRIVGMVKSPVEGSTIALIKMEEPVEMTDFVRPICLPEPAAGAVEGAAGGAVAAGAGGTCNTLGWTRNRDQLQRVHVSVGAMEQCENVSIAAVDGICAEALYEQDDCDEEEYAGSSMVCFEPAGKRWAVAGVSTWRIACTKIGAGRPRLYDAVAPNIPWIKSTLSGGDGGGGGGGGGGGPPDT